MPASCKAECQRRLLFFLLSLAPLLALSTPGHDAEKAGGFETFEAHRLTKGNRISRSLIHRSPPLPLNRKKTALLITCCTSCGSLSILLFRNVGEKKLRSEREREREREREQKQSKTLVSWPRAPHTAHPSFLHTALFRFDHLPFSCCNPFSEITIITTHTHTHTHLGPLPFRLMRDEETSSLSCSIHLNQPRPAALIRQPRSYPSEPYGKKNILRK